MRQATAMVANTATRRTDRPYRPYVRRNVWLADPTDGRPVKAFTTQAEAAAYERTQP